ncbi:histidine kinase dimerization/phosphoacceptor domain-containing protein, partial [Streptomyces sp. NPDC006356]
MRSASPQGCIRGFGFGAVLAASAVDLAYAYGTGSGLVPVAVLLAAGLAAVLWPARWRPRWLTVPMRTTVPAVLSLLYSAGSLSADRTASFGPGEVIVLISLLFLAVRHAPPRWALLCALLDAVALLALLVRRFGLRSESTMTLTVLGLVLIGLVAGLSAYLRSMDYRRTVAVGEMRRAERLAIAADLHDFVAHHVTGILVQTQMARMMAATARPDELDPV